MAGTGIVARTVADRHRVIVNDANPFAALLAHCHGIDATGVDPASIIDSLRDSYIRNYERLSAMIETRLEEEASFLHGELDDAMARRYAAFTSDPPLTVVAYFIAYGYPPPLILRALANALPLADSRAAASSTQGNEQFARFLQIRHIEAFGKPRKGRRK